MSCRKICDSWKYKIKYALKMSILMTYNNATVAKTAIVQNLIEVKMSKFGKTELYI